MSIYEIVNISFDLGAGWALSCFTNASLSSRNYDTEKEDRDASPQTEGASLLKSQATGIKRTLP